MPKITLELVRPHAGQQQVLAEARRFNVLACGRQFGKTTLAQQLVVEHALAGKACAWFAPIAKTSDLSWSALKETLRQLIADISEQARRVQVKGGGSAECWSLVDPDAGRGRQYDLVVVDEAGQVPELKHAWEESMRPMLAARRGSAWFLSTPTGVQHHFHVLFRKGQSMLLNREWKSWRMPTSMNPHIGADEIEAMRQDMSERAFAQEVLAEFVSWEGAVFSRLREAITDAPQGKAGIIGVDWAGSSGSGDFTAFCVLSTCGHILELVRLRGEPFMQQRKRLKGLWERWGKPPVLAEENGMGAVQNSELRGEGVLAQDWTTTNASKTEIVSKLVETFERGNVKIPNDEALIGELQSFQCTPLAGGLFRYSAPPGLHDDLVMALCIAYAGLGDAAKDAAKRKSRAEFFASCMAINESLRGSGLGGDDGGSMEKLPHEYPEGGSDHRIILGERWRN